MDFLLSRKITGLDIGTDTIKAVQITSGFTGFKVTGFAKRKRSKEISQDTITVLSREIREMLENESLNGDIFVSSISCDSVVIRNLELPFSNINKVRQVIRFEAEAVLPFLLDDILVDFSVVNMKSPDRSDLLVMAAPKEVLKDHLDIIREAGIEPEVVDLDSTAPFYCFKAGEEGKREGASSIIDIGARKTSVTIVKNGVLQFVRSIPVGGEDITEAISRELSVDRDKAEELKKKEGVILPCHIDSENTNTETESTGFKISKAIAGTLERLRRDIDLSFSFYESLNPDEKITKILLTGGTSKMRNINKYFQRELNADTTLFRPLQSLQISISDMEEDDEAIIAGALGLALRGAGKIGSWINFRKDEYALEKKFGDIRKNVTVALAGLFFLFSLHIGHLSTKLYLKESGYAKVKAETRQVFQETFPDVKNIVNELQQMKSKIQEKKDGMNGLQRDVSVLDNLREISIRIPVGKDIKITKLRISDGSISLIGQANSFDIVDKMHSSIKQSERFEGIEIRDAKMSTRERVVTFDLRMNIVQ